MAAPNNSLMKELHKLILRADKLFDGQVEIDFVDGFDNNDNDNNINDNTVDDNNDNDDNNNNKHESAMTIDFYIKPNGGLYAGAKIGFKMVIDVRNYPDSPPQVECKNNIYHPNIDVTGSYDEPRTICVNLLGSDWAPEVGLEGAILAVLFLFYHPELDDALSTVCCDVDWCQFEHNVFLSLRGKEVDDYCVFDKLIDDDDDAECQCDNCKNERTPVEEIQTPETTSDLNTTTGNTEIETDNVIDQLTATFSPISTCTSETTNDLNTPTVNEEIEPNNAIDQPTESISPISTCASETTNDLNTPTAVNEEIEPNNTTDQPTVSPISTCTSETTNDLNTPTAVNATDQPTESISPTSTFPPQPSVVDVYVPNYTSVEITQPRPAISNDIDKSNTDETQQETQPIPSDDNNQRCKSNSDDNNYCDIYPHSYGASRFSRWYSKLKDWFRDYKVFKFIEIKR